MSDYSEAKISEILEIVRSLKNYPPDKEDIRSLAQKVEAMQYDVKHIAEKMDSFLYQWERIKDSLATKEDVKH